MLGDDFLCYFLIPSLRSEMDFYAYHRYNVNAIEILIFECIKIGILFF
jgi:hypothetical protein